jgi:biotin carboxyl carrier protein
MTKFKLAFKDQQNNFNVTSQGNTFHVDYDGESLECRIRFGDDSYFVLELIGADGSRKMIHAAGFASGDNRQLWADGQMVHYTRVRQGAEATIEGSLSASIPAVVTQILIAPGDFTLAGEKLILLESMKMIIPIHAPYDGLVTAIYCQEGESVQAGKQLIELTRKEE